MQLLRWRISPQKTIQEKEDTHFPVFSMIWRSLKWNVLCDLGFLFKKNKVQVITFYQLCWKFTIVFMHVVMKCIASYVCHFGNCWTSFDCILCHRQGLYWNLNLPEVFKLVSIKRNCHLHEFQIELQSFSWAWFIIKHLWLAYIQNPLRSTAFILECFEMVNV